MCSLDLAIEQTGLSWTGWFTAIQLGKVNLKKMITIFIIIEYDPEILTTFLAKCCPNIYPSLHLSRVKCYISTKHLKLKFHPFLWNPSWSKNQTARITCFFFYSLQAKLYLNLHPHHHHHRREGGRGGNRHELPVTDLLPYNWNLENHTNSANSDNGMDV